MNLKDIYWIAGILEGEGSFGKNNTTVYITLGMTDKDVVDKFHTLVKFGSRNEFRHNEPNRKVLYRWTGAGRDAAALMMTIYTLMGTRRQARILEHPTFWKSKKLRKVRRC